ncbi:hypothetical protein J3R82DRAFT_8860 [Butyriboletus roseoflavus]|nr:hypothetical protein J3R82DRAFT_8860 [Butyriboletus roseoflavus]
MSDSEPEEENLSSRNGHEWFARMSKDPEGLVSGWMKGLERFFLQQPWEDTEKAAIQILRQMREVGKRKGYIEVLQPFIHTSGLAKMILWVSKQSMDFNHHSEFMQSSFRKYQWRESLLLSLANLSQGFSMKDTKTILKEMEELINQTTRTSQMRINPRKLLELISDRNMIPMAVKPHSIFFLSSEDNFIAACFDWLIWSVEQTKDMDDVKRMYSAICRLDENVWSTWNLSPTIKDILSLSKMLRNARKNWKVKAHRNRNRNRDPSNGECKTCMHLDDSHKCIQYLQVQESGLDYVLKNHMIIPEEGDAMNPKMSANEMEGRREKSVPLTYLDMEPIKFNKEIYDLCGQFAVHLVDPRTGEEVSGVVFGLLDGEEIERLAINQKKLKNLTTKLKRRKAFLDWNHGEMRPIGSRQPSGGRAGDGYSPYPATTVITQEDVHTLFNHALDIECILSKLHPHASSVIHEMEDLGREVNVLGQYGVTGYHCWNYIAPQHMDKDAAWTISYQLFKEKCHEDEFNFCLSHWGKVLETKANCAWWFKGEHLHGTVAPRASTVKTGNHLSQGIGITIPSRTVDMARKYMQARWSWKTLCEHWGAEL